MTLATAFPHCSASEHLTWTPSATAETANCVELCQISVVVFWLRNKLINNQPLKAHILFVSQMWLSKSTCSFTMKTDPVRKRCPRILSTAVGGHGFRNMYRTSSIRTGYSIQNHTLTGCFTLVSLHRSYHTSHGRSHCRNPFGAKMKECPTQSFYKMIWYNLQIKMKRIQWYQDIW